MRHGAAIFAKKARLLVESYFGVKALT